MIPDPAFPKGFGFGSGVEKIVKLSVNFESFEAF
jgi:hypothetical protein